MTTNALALIIGMLTLIGAVVAIVLAIVALPRSAMPPAEIDLDRDAAEPDAPAGAQSDVGQAHAYGLIPYVLTQTELSLFQALCDAAPEGLLVFPQVRLGGLVHPTARDRRRWHSAFNRIQANTVDFVICDVQTTAPRLVVELDDSSHDKPSRRVRDAFVDRVLESAGLPVLRVRWQEAYHREALAQLIYARLELRQFSSSEAPTVVASTHPARRPSPQAPTLLAPTHAARVAPAQSYISGAVASMTTVPASHLAQPDAPTLIATQKAINVQPRITQVACGTCGGSLRADSRFCTECGAALA